MNNQHVVSNEIESRCCCNVCGKTLRVENGLLKEDVFAAVKEWGYFSKRDLEVHQFNVCETCYEKMIDSFIIPVNRTDKKEVL